MPERSREDLLQHLLQHMRFIRRSAEGYDNGFEDEAKRIAGSVAILLHDTASSKSVLGQLGIKTRISFVNTATPYNPRNLLTHFGLCLLKVEGGTRRQLRGRA